MFQVLRQQFIGAWNYESQAQQLVVWPRTVAHSPVSSIGNGGSGTPFLVVTRPAPPPWAGLEHKYTKMTKIFFSFLTH